MPGGNARFFVLLCPKAIEWPKLGGEGRVPSVRTMQRPIAPSSDALCS